MFFIIVNLGWGSGGGARPFCRDFTINLSPQCRAFSRALKTEKLKAPLFPVGAGTTNDWCITGQSVLVYGMLTPEKGNRIIFSIFICFGVGARETRLSDNMKLG